MTKSFVLGQENRLSGTSLRRWCSSCRDMEHRTLYTLVWMRQSWTFLWIIPILRSRANGCAEDLDFLFVSDLAFNSNEGRAALSTCECNQSSGFSTLTGLRLSAPTETAYRCVGNLFESTQGVWQKISTSGLNRRLLKSCQTAPIPPQGMFISWGPVAITDWHGRDGKKMLYARLQ